jgi:hypothetical protein
MLMETHTAVVARNEVWTGSAATEPYEAGWAKEAIVWFRALHVEGSISGLKARVQISPDGMRWADEGATIALTGKPDAIAFARVREFGNWLRLAVDLPAGVTLKPLVTITLKG